MEERDTFAHAAAMGKIFQERLHALADHPLVGDTRGAGLIGALELVADKETKAAFPASAGVGAHLMKRCEANGLILRALGETLVFCPPLIITAAQVDELFTKVETSLAETLDWVR
jgi:4-aminobutyrate--pyruvate transaminase